MNLPRAQTGTRLSLAVFGKHPGWDDHIEGLGLDSALLIQARQVLYVRGIGGNIESGAWDKLEQEGKSLPFHHVVAWLAPENLVLGRVWASRDGKGRGRYPMVALIESDGLSLERALEVVLPRLEALERKCAALTSAKEVRDLVENLRRELREVEERIQRSPETPRAAETPGERLTRLNDCPALKGTQGPGLRRILHKIWREWAAYAPGRKATDPESRRPNQLRVPRCAEGVEQAAALWGRAIGDQVDPAETLMLLLPIREPWLDVLVGAPGSAQIYCLKANTNALPLTSDVPYTWNDEFSRRVEHVLNKARQPGATEVSIFGAAQQHAGPLDALAQSARRWWRQFNN